MILVHYEMAADGPRQSGLLDFHILLRPVFNIGTAKEFY